MNQQKRIKPNIVMIILDTTRASHLSCYGYKRNTSPHIDDLAREGILFKNAISPSPWTLPSHVSILTGQYPCQHRMTEDHISDGKNIYAMSAGHEFNNFLPGILKKENYQTVGFSNNPWISANFGFDRGFDSFFEIWRTTYNQSFLKKALKMVKRALPQRFHPIINDIRSRLSWFFSYDSGAKNTIAVMKKWFSKNYQKDIPLFVFFNFMEPHLPYTPPPPFNKLFIEDKLSKKNIRKINQDHLKLVANEVEMDSEDFEILKSLYDGEIAYLDTKLQNIFDLFRNMGLFDETIWIITSDHGENIGEHNLMGHQFCLYDTLIRVPLILRYPEIFPKGKTEDRYVQSLNIYFTLLDILGIHIRDLDVHERSLLNQNKNEQIVSEHEVPKIALKALKNRFPDFQTRDLEQELKCIYLNEMKYIWKSKGKDELYDLIKDPEERNNLIQADTSKASELSKILKEWIASKMVKKGVKSEKNRVDSRGGVDEDIKNQLEGLGYI